MEALEKVFESIKVVLGYLEEFFNEVLISLGIKEEEPKTEEVTPA